MTVPVPGALGHPDEPAPRILLVEDDDVIREATTMALERYGFSVRTATDGLTGRTAYRAALASWARSVCAGVTRDGYHRCGGGVTRPGGALSAS